MWYRRPSIQSSTDANVTKASPLGLCKLSCPITTEGWPSAPLGMTSGAKKLAISSLEAYPLSNERENLLCKEVREV